MAPAMPCAPSVSTTSAPYAFKSVRRSTLMVSGMVNITRYPQAAATAASPMPVFPLVGSMMTAPGCSSPRARAPDSMARATRSFTDPAGFKYSSFAISVAVS